MKLGIYIKNFKIYYQVLEELKRRKIDFVEIFPGDDDSDLIVLTDSNYSFKNCIYVENPLHAIRKSLSKLYGKESFNEIFVGIDPGERVGLAVFGDGICLEEFELTELGEIINTIENIFNDYLPKKFLVRIGMGDEPNRNRIINLLFGKFKLELVDEYGTTSIKNRNIEAAKKIALKKGKLIRSKMEIRPRRGEISEVQRKSRIASNNLVTISRELAKKVIKGELDLNEAIEIQKKG
ncbi:MAG: hypothetical protein QXG55_02790 [Thermoplasmata archaeon]